MSTINEATSSSTVVNNNKTTAITPTDVMFHEDTITAFVANDGEVYAAAKQVLRNIGFDEERCKSIRRKWKEDEVVSTNGAYFPLSYSNEVGTYSHDTYCLPNKILPLALAKITITPTLKKEYPAVVEKLISYQLECADVLYKHFFQNKTEIKEPTIYEGDQIPITREELTFYFASFADGINNFFSSLSSLITGIANENKTFLSSVDKRLDLMEKNYTSLQNAFSVVDSRSEKLESSLSKALWKISSNIQGQSTDVIDKKKLNPHLNNSKSFGDTQKWLKNAWKSAEIIGKCSGHKRNYVMRELCNGLREKGINIDSLWDEYHSLNTNKDAKINMISESDYLRPLAEDVFHELHQKYLNQLFGGNTTVSKENKTDIKDKAEKKVYKSQLLLKTPIEVQKLIEKVATNRNCLQHVAAAYVYKEIESRTNKNLKELASKYAEKLGYVNCSKAYYISKNKDMMEILNSIAEGK